MAISYSQLQTYRRCPKQYEYASVKKVSRPISEGESFGSSIHNALKKWGELEISKTTPADTKKQLLLFTEAAPPPGAELTLATLLQCWRQCFIAEGYKNRAEMDAALLRGERALKNFYEWWSKKPRTVIAIEKSFKFTVPGHEHLTLTGRFDRMERSAGGITIIDFKSTAPRPPEELITDLQLSLYALAAKQIWPEPVEKLILLSITEDQVTEQATVRTENQLADAITSIRLIHERIDQKDFVATPGVQVCSHCPYRDICPASLAKGSYIPPANPLSATPTK